MATVSRHNGMLDLLVGYVRLLQTRQKPMSDRFGHIAAAHLRDLMVAALEAEPDCGPTPCERGGVRVARRRAFMEIGRASGRERVCQSVSVSGVAAPLTKTKLTK